MNNKIEIKLNNLTEELKQTRQKNDFNEIHLSNFEFVENSDNYIEDKVYDDLKLKIKINNFFLLRLESLIYVRNYLIDIIFYNYSNLIVI